MARLELAKNVWWAKMTYDEQVEYLKGHPRSKLKLTRRKPRKGKSAEEEPQTGSPAEEPKEDPVAEETLPEAEGLSTTPTPEEQQKVLDAVVNHEGTVELSDEEKDAGAEVLSEQIAPALEQDALDEEFGEDDKADFEDEFEEILNEDDSEERSSRFLKTALRFAVKAGVITAAFALTGGNPTVLFVPSVMASIWDTATDWSDRSESLFDKAAGTLHRVFKNGAQDHITHGMRKSKRND